MTPSSAFTARRAGYVARRAGYVLLGAAVLSASLLTRSLLAPATHAALGGCRSDPIVTLSNGYAFDLHATVDDTYADIQQVTYTLHAPVGTWVTNEVDTSVLGGKETFLFRADNPPNTYSAATKVDTLTPHIPVVAATDLVKVTGTVLSIDRVSGQSQQMLWMNVSG
jgi:hypothetical protein